MLRAAGVAASASLDAVALVEDTHLRERGFWVDGLPGLPWRSTLGAATGPAPAQGADTEAVLAEVLDLDADAIARLRQAGAFGAPA